MLIVGIDPSFTGFAICRHNTETMAFAMRRFTSQPEGHGLRQRFARYAHFLAAILPELKADEASLILIEGYAYSRQGSVIALAEFGGVLRDALLDTGVQVEECPPTTLKKFATGKGGGNGADKLGVSLAIQKRYGVTFQTSDEFDAYGLARLGACFMGAEQPQTAAQAEAVATLRGEKWDRGSATKRKTRSKKPSTPAVPSGMQPKLFT